MERAFCHKPLADASGNAPASASTMRRMRILLVLIAVIAAGRVCASGGEPGPERGVFPSAGSVRLGSQGGGADVVSHGWIALPEPTALNASATVLAHVPPRAGVGGTPGADDGVLFPATRLEAMPAAIAACDDRVYLLFGPQGVYGGAGYRVLSLRAIPTPIAGMYAYEPRGLLDAHPSLLRVADLRGVVGTPWGPVALMHTPGPTDAPRVFRLDSASWIETSAIPTQGAEGLDVSSPVWIASEAAGVLVVGRTRGGALSAWAGRPVDGGLAPGERVVELWTWSRRPLGVPGFGLEGTQFLGIGRMLNAVVREGDSISIWSEAGGQWSRVASREGAGSPFGVLGLGDVSRVVAAWQGEAPMADGASGDPLRPRPVMVWEVSGATGLVMHDGEAARRGPLSSQDLRALVVLLLGSTAAVLLFVVRVGDDPGVVALPDGAEIASPSRRISAALIDVGVALGAVWAVTGATPGAVLDVLRITPEGLGVVGVIDLVMAGFVVSTLMEGVFGRTVGKVVAGCEVLAVVDRRAVDRRGVGLGRAAIRNAVRWGLPPAALLGVFEPGGRHRGDAVARTIVVSRFEAEAEQQG